MTPISRIEKILSALRTGKTYIDEALYFSRINRNGYYSGDTDEIGNDMLETDRAIADASRLLDELKTPEPPVPPVKNHPDKSTIIFWAIVALFLTLARMTYPEQSTSPGTRPDDWYEPTNIRIILTDAGNDNNLPRGLSHVIAYHESRFNPHAQSKYVGGYRSRGLMQIYFKYQNTIVRNHSTIGSKSFVWYNPEHSANAGCGYLSYLINRFGGSVYLGVLAYTWGEGNVERMTSMDQIPPHCANYAESVLRMLDTWEEWW